jgi:hypothetical protein
MPMRVAEYPTLYVAGQEFNRAAAAALASLLEAEGLVPPSDAARLADYRRELAALVAQTDKAIARIGGQA